SPAFTMQIAQHSLDGSLRSGGRSSQWWFGAGHLYEVFLQPIYFGPAKAESSLGVLAVGYEIDDRVAKEISQIAASQVAFWYGKSVAVSTLSSDQESELARQPNTGFELDPGDVQLGNERYLVASLDLA